MAPSEASTGAAGADTPAATNGSAPTANGAPTNGHGERSRGLRSRLIGAAMPIAGRVAGPVSKVALPLVGSLQRRLTADLDDRDPDFIRESLPTAWLMASIWFRGEVRGMGKIPEKGPVLIVSNHSGGNLTPDTTVFTLAFYTYFGVERRFHQLAHNLVLASPVGPYLRRFGTVAASHQNARKALDAGAAVLVYPGGDWEVHRPSWQTKKVDFAGRKGFVRLALEAGVPVVPVVAAGGQETAIFLSHGQRLSKALRLDKLFRLKVLPISIAPPWGLNIGDFFGHIPLPAKITVQVLDPIDIPEEFGPEPDHEEVYDAITSRMQTQLDRLYDERRFPVIG